LFVSLFVFVARILSLDSYQYNVPGSETSLETGDEIDFIGTFLCQGVSISDFHFVCLLLSNCVIGSRTVLETFPVGCTAIARLKQRILLADRQMRLFDVAFVRVQDDFDALDLVTRSDQDTAIRMTGVVVEVRF
jgi:hypothetical protein